MPRKTDPQILIALFRGINVGGNKIVRMEELRALFHKLGYSGARTLIQSGNVLFRSKDPPAKAATRITGAFKSAWPFEAAVLVRSAEEWRAILGRNPFEAATKDPKRLHVGCLMDELQPPEREALEKAKTAREKWQASGTTLYAYHPDGAGTSKLAAAIARLKSTATMRNWDTAVKILAIAEELAETS